MRLLLIHIRSKYGEKNQRISKTKLGILKGSQIRKWVRKETKRRRSGESIQKVQNFSVREQRNEEVTGGRRGIEKGSCYLR